MLRPVRGLRAPAKLALFALALVALWHLAPLLPSSSPPSLSSIPLDPRAERKAFEQFGLTRERGLWVGKHGDDEEALAKDEGDAAAGEEERRAAAAAGAGGGVRGPGQDAARARQKYYGGQQQQQRGGEDEGEREWAPRGQAPPRRVGGDAPRPAARRPRPAAPPPPAPPAGRRPAPQARPPAFAAAAKEGTYEEELRAVEARRARQREKLREWDERMAAAEAQGEPVPNAAADNRKPAAAGAGAGGAGRRKRPGSGGAADEEDELDAAPRAGAAPPRKKGPLIQVGGAKAAAALGGGGGGGAGSGEDAEAGQQKAAAAAAAAARDRAGIKGWDQRFKKAPPAPAAAAPEAPPEEADSSSEEGTVGDEPPSLPPPVERTVDLLEHRLVARFAAFDYSPSGRLAKTDLVIDPNEDSFQLADSKSKKASGDDAPRYNVTRFLDEWLLYHRLLGVENFALYDTSHPGTFGAAEVDALADKMHREGGGELNPTVEELKARVGTTDAGPDGLDERGQIRKERIAGMERWIDQETVKLHWLKFSDSRKGRDFHSHMLEHCTATYGSSSNWLIHLDVDEFLSVTSSLYGADAPYPPAPSEDDPTTSSSWQYPLHDLLARPELADAACIPLPELNYRNLGVRELAKGQGVLDTQTHRDVLKQGKRVVREEGLQQKTLIHTAYSSSPSVYFAGPHSCEVTTSGVAPPEGLTNEIKTSQGVVLQDGGLYEVAKLPIEPLAIAHYLQRDLVDCLSKISSLSDPNDARQKSRGVIACEAHYLPTPAELASAQRGSAADQQQNRFLLQTPAEGSVIEDRRMSDSWAARAAKGIRDYWRRAERVSGLSGGPRVRGKARAAQVNAVPREIVQRARDKVQVITI
ncbi:hypothetical protein Rhopal_004068-T1 [Rhodotorula paludigena]|uniref:Glycosyltransferase family 92 protein n=1 Tax=Rhodotorula paludigena TaxID=86838 RepID=A0AAV5GLH4_9BASI|nr:hypothetical protein Rhopal_004068-T1 [Rhodotorula paludigena]